jgi:hypothetical protein
MSTDVQAQRGPAEPQTQLSILPENAPSCLHLSATSDPWLAKSLTSGLVACGGWRFGNLGVGESMLWVLAVDR